LYWRGEGEKTMDLAVGCIDPEFLFDEAGAEEDGGDGGNVGGGERRRRRRRGGGGGEGGEEGAYGLALAGCTGSNFWCVNEIKGVTDKMITGRKLTTNGATAVFMT
jgi:hypothetical protein